MRSIKRARRARGMSLADVATRSGLHREAVARAERDETDPRASTVAAIAAALAAPVCELFEVTGHGRRAQKK
jgi:transcriptional regulator with XRE-family HTH domain